MNNFLVNAIEKLFV